MNQTCTWYEALAGLLAYPGSDYFQKLAGCRALLEEAEPGAEGILARFAESIHGLSTEELQELYTRTFDLNPLCSLEVGWHLYGENYARGDFLVQMRQELRRSGLPESTELPDHLTHVLTALGHMDQHHADRFTLSYLAPALEKMLVGLTGKNNPFESLLEAVRTAVLSQSGAVGCLHKPC